MTCYTFIYCMLHDDGCIITGNHPYVPAGYVMAHATNCESCDWYTMGVIQYNGSSFDIVQTLRVNYDKYGGGFIFRLYSNTLTDEKGNSIENVILDNLIDNIAESITDNDIFIE